MGRKSNTPPQTSYSARRAANTVMLLALVGAGVSLSLWLGGNRDLAWQVCGGFTVVTLVVLVIGGLIVAKSK
jgi:heme/copper-type cytochrome/quinol oxidase subunit 4